MKQGTLPPEMEARIEIASLEEKLQTADKAEKADGKESVL